MWPGWDLTAEPGLQTPPNRFCLLAAHPPRTLGKKKSYGKSWFIFKGDLMQAEAGAVAAALEARAMILKLSIYLRGQTCPWEGGQTQPWRCK